MYFKTIRHGVLVLLCALPMLASANPSAPNPNFCLDDANQKQFADLLANNLSNTSIVRLVALRQGLCELVSHQQIPLATAMDLWAHERQNVMLEKTKRRLNRLKQKTD
ncbi:hypothetical protein JCM14076_08590 [Methylosoma difficile]